MTARKSPDGTIAFLVENYLANPGGAYGFSPLNIGSRSRRGSTLAHPRQRHRVQSRTFREGELREVLQLQPFDRDNGS
jgi:hypothetical protein